MGERISKDYYKWHTVVLRVYLSEAVMSIRAFFQKGPLFTLFSTLGTIGLLILSHTRWPWSTGITAALPYVKEDVEISWGILSLASAIIWVAVVGSVQIVKQMRAPTRPTTMLDGNFKDIVEDELALLADAILNLTPDDRITLYKHSGRAFFRLGRYSANPELAKRGRPIYLDTEGCMGRAWQMKECYDNGAPAADHSSTEYEKYMKEKWDIKKKDSRGFRMKSRCYCAFRIDQGPKKLAVLVFESVRPDGLDFDKLKELVSEQEGPRLAYLLNRYAEMVPDPAIPAEAGF